MGKLKWYTLSSPTQHGWNRLEDWENLLREEFDFPASHIEVFFEDHFYGYTAVKCRYTGIHEKDELIHVNKFDTQSIEKCIKVLAGKIEGDYPTDHPLEIVSSCGDKTVLTTPLRDTLIKSELRIGSK